LNADNVMLNFSPVDHQGLEYVCPQSTMMYILLAWNEQEKAVETIMVEVEHQPPAAPTQFSIGNWICNPPIYSVTLQWIDMADNETGFRIYRDGQLIATLGADVESYTDNPPPNVSHTYGVEAYNPAGASSRPTLQEGICQQ
jgi:hypothetical protein